MAEISDLNVIDESNTSRFPEGMSPSAVNDGARQLEGILARWFADTNGSLVSTGANGIYAISPSRAIASVVDGLGFKFRANHANPAAAPTLNVAFTGAVEIAWPNGDALSAGDIPLDGVVEVVYAGAKWRLVSPTKKPFADPLTTAGDLIYRSASATTRLPVGPANYVLKSSGTDIAWSTVDLDSWSITGQTRGDLLVRGASAWQRLQAGDLDLFLKSAGPGLEPVWGTGKGVQNFGAKAATGASVEWTGIETDVRVLLLQITNVKTSGSDTMRVQLGSSSGTYQTTGYTGRASWLSQGEITYPGTDAIINAVGQSTTPYIMQVIMTRMQDDTWSFAATGIAILGSGPMLSNGFVQLGYTADRIRIKTSGANTFTQGTFHLTAFN